MRIGISTPAWLGGQPATLEQVVDQVGSIARQGFATAYFAHIRGFDALTTIAIAGRVVPQVELATAVVPIYIHHPVALAQQALTTQAAVEGRLVLGIGLSHKPAVEQSWGLSFEHPLDYMREYLNVLDPLLDGQPVRVTGRRLSANTELTIPGANRPRVILAALGEGMLRLAGERADGTALWLVGPKTVANHVTPIITEAARRAHRSQPRIIVGLPICVTTDVATTRERTARGLAAYGNLPSYRAMLDREGVDGPADVMVVGSESDVERQLQALEDAGATDFNASIVGSREDQQRTLDFLQEMVTHGRRAAV